jgi:hypothetical protein
LRAGDAPAPFYLATVEAGIPNDLPRIRSACPRYDMGAPQTKAGQVNPAVTTAVSPARETITL